MIGVSIATIQHIMVVQPAKERDKIDVSMATTQNAMVVQPAKEISTN